MEDGSWQALKILGRSTPMATWITLDTGKRTVRSRLARLERRRAKWGKGLGRTGLRQTMECCDWPTSLKCGDATRYSTKIVRLPLVVCLEFLQASCRQVAAQC